MIGYLKYFTNNLANSITNFPNLDLVQTVKILCDVTVMCANDSLHGVCFPTVFTYNTNRLASPNEKLFAGMNKHVFTVYTVPMWKVLNFFIQLNKNPCNIF